MRSVPPTADVETIDRARAGERDAIGELWRLYQPQLLRVLRSRGIDSVDDVASQTWIDVGRALARFEGNGTDFRRWLFTIARNRSIDQARRTRRQAGVELTETSGSTSQIARPDEFAEVGSLDRALATLRRLPDDQAEAVMLRVVYDMSIVDVAGVMGMSPGNVRVLVHRGLKRLRRDLELDFDLGRDDRDDREGSDDDDCPSELHAVSRVTL